MPVTIISVKVQHKESLCDLHFSQLRNVCKDTALFRLAQQASHNSDYVAIGYDQEEYPQCRHGYL